MNNIAPVTNLQFRHAGPPGVENADNLTSSGPPTVLQRIKRFFGGDKLDRERLKQLGLGAVCSYGFVSNITYGTERHHCAAGAV